MSNDPVKATRRVLKSSERFAELLSGLILVLTFTGSLFGFGQHPKRISTSRCFIQRLLRPTRRDARGTPVLFLSQPVALHAGHPARCFLFLPVFQHRPSQLRLKVAHALARSIDHGQVAAGDFIEQTPAGRLTPVLATVLAGDAHQNLPVNLVQFQ